MTRIEPVSLGGFTLICGSTCAGGDITPLELSSFRLRLSAPFGEGSLFDGPVSFDGAVPAWEASTEIVETVNWPRMIARASAARLDQDMPVFRSRPNDMASLLVFYFTRDATRVTSATFHPKVCVTGCRSSACGRWSRYRSSNRTLGARSGSYAAESPLMAVTVDQSERAKKLQSALAPQSCCFRRLLL
jgi:hypothetical protein